MFRRRRRLYGPVENRQKTAEKTFEFIVPLLTDIFVDIRFDQCETPVHHGI